VLAAFREIVLVDFEFEAGHGERQKPVCLCACELRSGRKHRMWREELPLTPPYPTGADVLFVSFYASAELGCHLALGWPLPQRVLDLYAEFRNLTNGLVTPAGRGLTGALVYFGLPVSIFDKENLRSMVLGGGPWGESERRLILDYCHEDVVALARLLPVMVPRIDLPRALLRGRYMAAAARMEWAGVPIDTAMLERLRYHWTGIENTLIDAIDRDYGVYGVDRSFNSERFAAWLNLNNIPWPRLISGRLDLSDDTFRQQARVHPSVAPLRELRSSLSELRLHDLMVGRDGRNRTILSAFRARTGRNQPSNSKFVFGPSVWIRGLIKPPPGHAVAYIDWSQQEFGIAASLSGDAAMQDAYRSGDPYLAFAKQAGAVPADGTKKTHGHVRELYKTATLAVQYGMVEWGLASRIGEQPIVARNLLAAHRHVYRRFWQWSDAAIDHAVLHGTLGTVFGWNLHVVAGFNARSLRNFPMQANGAEMLRLACCLATERGVTICAPVHDALLICAPFARIHADIATTQAAMAEAARIVLDGFELRTDVNIVPWPRRYSDPRGRRMWETVTDIIAAADRKRAMA
jgi:DNA polymerase family A